MFFKNRAVQITLVKPQGTTDTPTAEVQSVDPETIFKMATEFTVKTALVVGAVVAATIVLKAVCDTASEVTIAKLK